MSKYRINRALADKQKLTEEDITKIEGMWIERDKIVRKMKGLDPERNKEELLKLFDAWKENEFKLQETWKFGRNENFHEDYWLPHCICPKLDNQDIRGTEMRYITAGCVYHHKKQ